MEIHIQGAECPRDRWDRWRDRWDMPTGQTGHKPGGVPPKFCVYWSFPHQYIPTTRFHGKSWRNRNRGKVKASSLSWWCLPMWNGSNQIASRPLSRRCLMSDVFKLTYCFLVGRITCLILWPFLSRQLCRKLVTLCLHFFSDIPGFSVRLRVRSWCCFTFVFVSVCALCLSFCRSLSCSRKCFVWCLGSPCVSIFVCCFPPLLLLVPMVKLPYPFGSDAPFLTVRMCVHNAVSILSLSLFALPVLLSVGHCLALEHVCLVLRVLLALQYLFVTFPLFIVGSHGKVPLPFGFLCPSPSLSALTDLLWFVSFF